MVSSIAVSDLSASPVGQNDRTFLRSVKKKSQSHCFMLRSIPASIRASLHNHHRSDIPLCGILFIGANYHVPKSLYFSSITPIKIIILYCGTFSLESLYLFLAFISISVLLSLTLCCIAERLYGTTNLRYSHHRRRGCRALCSGARA